MRTARRHVSRADASGRASCIAAQAPRSSPQMDEPVIYREEVVALQFTLNDISATLLQIERLLGEDEDDGEEEEDDG